jgi:hypothetical protein
VILLDTNVLSELTRDRFDVTDISLVNPWDFVMPEPVPSPEA